MTTTQGEHAQTELSNEALRLASWLDCTRGDTWPSYVPQEAAAELRRLHAQVAALTAERPVASATIPRAYSGRERGAYEAGWDDGFDHGKRTAAPAQPAPQGVAYAELPASYQSSTLIVGNDGCTVTFHFGTGGEADVESWLSAVTERAFHGQAPAGDEQKALAALRYYKTECSGAELSISVFHRMVDEALEAAPADGEEFQRFTTGDSELNDLLNETFAMARGPSTHDTAMLWLEALEAVKARLAPAAGAVAVPCETLVAWRQWCAQSMSHAIEHEISDWLAAAPTPAAQADSQPAPVREESAAPKLRAMAINYPEGACWDKLDAQACMEGALEIEALRASRAQADSVLEDAARWKFVESAPSAITLRLHNLRPDQRAQYVDAARKQGGA